MQSRLQRIWIRILLTVLTAAMMTLLFFFSTEPAERSDATSGRVSMTVISVVHPDFETYSPAQKQSLFAGVQHIVRKTAHFTEYTILGMLLRLCIESWIGKRKTLIPLSWAAGTLYACTDELHQLIIDGRSGQWSDVLLDSSGVLTGVLLISLVLLIIRRKERGKDGDEYRAGESGNPPEHR